MRRKARKIGGAAYQASPDKLNPAQKRDAVKKIVNSAGSAPFPPRQGPPRKWMRRVRGRKYSGA